MIAVSTTELKDLINLIYKKTGIKFEEKKLYFISKRLEKRMEATGCETVREYIRYLKFRDKSGDEFQELMNLLTINETYFFREFPTLQAFAEHCLPRVIENKKKTGSNKIRIWSAGCSTGEEPYTLAIICKEMIDDFDEWDVNILATDIDRNALAKAKLGRYSDRSVSKVPEEYYEKYFYYDNGSHCVVDEIKKLVTFEHLNLMDSVNLRKKKGFDFIFCRNVLIYFDDISRRQVVNHFYMALNKGGYIFLGHSESVGRITTAFKLKKYGEHLVYVKE
ncbi:chemotaxis protein methyltransferase CheR [Deferribacter desulfuricans SSM1]|uniref:protein-glutamate O-methyltransferase n=1 Tax=Deferribacter desulfuricans (strain DSM 14783 / JCM 11476 / NBRC 101012 / SSM1) TaxID=639282 RepID=D3PDJ7_DEFDS|nr:protein-glutamate O-methyltransferase CheR [Deferribacter desulfuricans]BAI80670.1 chemotaxis protein methyltransferase CheR [Deferribacter desulfuricans SSM1]